MSSTPAAALSGSPASQETKALKETEKLASPNWSVIHGDLEKLLVDENYADCLILERSDLSLEQLKKSESDSPKVMQVIFGSAEILKLDPNDPLSTARMPTGRQSFYMLLFLGKDRRRAEKAHFSHENYNLSDEENKLLDESEKDLFKFFRNYNQMPILTIIEKLFDQGRLETTDVLRFYIGDMRGSLVEILFNILHKLKLLTQEDVQYLQSLCKHREPSKMEEILNEKLEEAISTQNYKKAVEVAAELHALSRKEAFERGTHLYARTNDITKLNLFDDCEAAFKLGEALELVSPEDAIAAFSIIADYELKEMAFDAYYQSFFTFKTLEKIADIRTTLLSTVTDESKLRPIREQSIRDAFSSLTAEDEQAETRAMKLMANLIETHAGFENMGSEGRLFDKIDVKMGQEFFVQILLAMANKLYEYRKGSKTLAVSEKGKQTSAAAACEGEVKQKAENPLDISFSKGDSKQAAEKNTISLTAFASAASAAPLTYMKQLSYDEFFEGDLGDEIRAGHAPKEPIKTKGSSPKH